MRYLILPVAGLSSRFPDMRPKWMLTMPNGKLMVEQSVSKINTRIFKKVFIVALKKHIDDYCDRRLLISSLKKNISKNVELVELKKPTTCQASTAVQLIKKTGIKGSILIKDCDNQFKIETKDLKKDVNSIFTIDVNTQELIDAKNKSYVEINKRNDVINIIEKKIISDLFCCGAYAFKSSNSFIKNAEELLKESNDVYISHVIFKMLFNGERFKSIEASNYSDWGTLKEFRSFQKKNITIFCDFDGCLVINGSKFGKNGWNSSPIESNLKILKKISLTYNLKLIITTSRPKSQIKFINKILRKYDFKNILIITDLPHGKRILVNDFSNTNPYPSAEALNITRDSDELKRILNDLVF